LSSWIDSRPKAFLLLILAAVCLVYAAAGSARILRYGSTTALIGFGCVQEVCFAEKNSQVLPHPALVYRTGGYDGQFFFYYAAELYGGPASSLDFRPLRAVRLGYPLLTGWAFRTAGPQALVVVMALVPLLLHAAAIWLMWRTRGLFSPMSILLFALNPFSLKSFLLSTADGMALSFAMPALCAAFALSRPIMAAASAAVLLSAAALTKETMLASTLGCQGGACMAAAWSFVKRPNSGDRGSAPSLRAEGALILGALLSLIPVLLWWWKVDFHLGQASSRGTLPFLGLVRYLGHPDAVVSGRSFLVLILLVYMAACLICFYDFLKSDSARMRLILGVSASSLACAVGLIAFASAEEYWINFANIGRLFAAGVPGLAAAISQSPTLKRHALLASAPVLLLTPAILRDELFRELLPVEIWN
jgi:hypothetical protein